MGADYVDTTSFVAKDLHRAIPMLIPRLTGTIREALGAMFFPEPSLEGHDSTQEYASVVAMPASMNAIASIVSQAFVGEKYGKDKSFTTTLMDFSHGIMLYDILLRRVPKAMRQFISELFPTRRRVNRLREMMKDDVCKVVESHTPFEENDSLEKDQNIPGTYVIQLLVNFVRKRPQYEMASNEEVFRAVTARMLTILFAAIDTTSLTFTQVLFNLISHPHSEYAKPMTTQIQEVLDKNGGVWDVNSLAELKLLDSFIKETQRLHPILLVISSRSVLPVQGHTFKPTLEHAEAQPIHIPPSSRVELPLWGVHTDPDNYDDPMKFEGFRFAQDSAPPGQLNQKFLTFGYGKNCARFLLFKRGSFADNHRTGRHACPGRHLAITIVKLMMIELLLNYDWREMERPQDMSYGLYLIPNYSAKVAFRRKGN